MLYNFMQMPRSEIHDIFIDLHDQKVAMSHEIIELKMRCEKYQERQDSLEETCATLDAEVTRLEPFERMFLARQEAAKTVGGD